MPFLLPPRPPGRAVEERPQLAGGAPLREALERLPAGHHQGDHRARQVLAQPQSPRHGEEGDQVHSEPPLPQGLGRGDGERQEGEGRGQRPGRVRRAPGAVQEGDRAARQTSQDGERQGVAAKEFAGR